MQYAVGDLLGGFRIWSLPRPRAPLQKDFMDIDKLRDHSLLIEFGDGYRRLHEGSRQEHGLGFDQLSRHLLAELTGTRPSEEAVRRLRPAPAHFDAVWVDAATLQDVHSDRVPVDDAVRFLACFATSYLCTCYRMSEVLGDEPLTRRQEPPVETAQRSIGLLRTSTEILLRRLSCQTSGGSR